MCYGHLEYRFKDLGRIAVRAIKTDEKRTVNGITIWISKLLVNHLLIVCGMFIIFIMWYVYRIILLEITATIWKIYPSKLVKDYLKTLLHSFFSKDLFKNYMTDCYFGNTFFEEKSWSSNLQVIFLPKLLATMEHISFRNI